MCFFIVKLHCHYIYFLAYKIRKMNVSVGLKNLHNCSFAHFVLRKTAFSSVHSINYWIYLYWWNLFHLLPRKNLRQNLNWQITYCLFLVMRSENIFARIMTKLWRPKPFYESVILWLVDTILFIPLVRVAAIKRNPTFIYWKRYRVFRNFK